MTIRKQLNCFIAAILGIPVLAIVFVFLIRYYTSSERVFKHGYQKIKNDVAITLSQRDEEIIHDAIRDLSKEKQACLIIENAILISSIPELREKTWITEGELWEFIKNTSNEYYYQIETPPLGRPEQKAFLLSRMNKDRQMKERKAFATFAVALSLFIIFCTVVVFTISHSIFSSIRMIETETHKIADGALSESIKIKTEKQNEITNISVSLEKMRLSLKEAQERRSRFIMGISHDFRTPIAVIKGYTEAMSDGVFDEEEERKQALEIITKKTLQLESMVDTLINYEKLSSNKWKVNMEEVDISTFLTTFAKTSAATGELFNKTVTYSIDIHESTKTKMNIQLAQRAIENIFNNAVRYTPDGASIHISATEDENSIYIRISDTGCGISKEDQEKIFELFYRGTNSRREEGMGIGLSVVKNITEIHGWQITVESEIDKGTAFTITIPKKPEHAENNGAEQS